ncbi:unnamed protein product [Prorocentrum cordatum]|uniref:Mut7-C RNAse domain-containing protein n=1 Tax=Prorocentrum cordatum TaxID=2364126 RepID=A0ABN9VKS0_9DINO|nr:unnamed protein product [Polarella glacialis]
MQPLELAGRLEVLLSVTGRERSSVSQHLQRDLASLEAPDVCALLHFCERLQPREAAATGTRLLVKACEGRGDLSLAELMGLQLDTLLRLVRGCPALARAPADDPELADGLLAKLLCWCEGGAAVDAGTAARRVGCGLPALEAVGLFGLAAVLPGETLQSLLQQVLWQAPGPSLGQLKEAGAAAPGLRPRMLWLALEGCRRGEGLLDPRELVKLSHRWGVVDEQVMVALEELLQALRMASRPPRPRPSLATWRRPPTAARCPGCGSGATSASFSSTARQSPRRPSAPPRCGPRRPWRAARACAWAWTRSGATPAPCRCCSWRCRSTGKRRRPSFWWTWSQRRTSRCCCTVVGCSPRTPRFQGATRCWHGVPGRTSGASWPPGCCRSLATGVSPPYLPGGSIFSERGGRWVRSPASARSSATAWAQTWPLAARKERVPFLLPSELNRLMRKLRGIGIDSVLLPEGASLQALASTAKREDRVILARPGKRQLGAEALGRTYFVRAERPDEQLQEVIDVFGVRVDSQNICGRCVECNASNWVACGSDEVRGEVADKVLARYQEFWRCGGCGKVFWEGSMFEKAVSHFRTFVPCERSGGGGGGASEGSAPPSVSTSQGAGEAPATAQKYLDMRQRGLSGQRVRAQMVRDGILAAGQLPLPRCALDEGPGPCAAAAWSGAASLVRSLFEAELAAGRDPGAAAAAALRAAAAASGA